MNRTNLLSSSYDKTKLIKRTIMDGNMLILDRDLDTFLTSKHHVNI